MSAIDTLFAANDNKPKRVRDHKARWAKRNAKEPERECEHCGTLFRAAPSKGSPRRFCSVDCRNANVAAARSLKANSGRVSHTVFRPLCELCGKRFTAMGDTKTVCPECALERSRERGRVAALARHHATYEIDRSPRECPECGVTFNREPGVTGLRFCSEACGNRHHNRIAKGRREARMRSVANDNVNPFRVFDRDGWRCRWCGVKTPLSLRGTYDTNAPELDHIIPLSKGGPHTYENTQLLCRTCNGRKSDKIIPDNDNDFTAANAA